MAHPSPKVTELARRIVEQEAGEKADPAASAAAVETACRKLRDELVDTLGSGGVSALFRRALHMAQREEPLLATLAVSGEPAACFFTGLAESLAASTDEEATAAAATVLTHIVDLLVILLGEELGMKPIRKLWPQETSVKEIDG